MFWSDVYEDSRGYDDFGRKVFVWFAKSRTPPKTTFCRSILFINRHLAFYPAEIRNQKTKKSSFLFSLNKRWWKNFHPSLNIIIMNKQFLCNANRPYNTWYENSNSILTVKCSMWIQMYHNRLPFVLISVSFCSCKLLRFVHTAKV